MRRFPLLGGLYNPNYSHTYFIKSKLKKINKQKIGRDSNIPVFPKAGRDNRCPMYSVSDVFLCARLINREYNTIKFLHRIKGVTLLDKTYNSEIQNLLNLESLHFFALNCRRDPHGKVGYKNKRRKTENEN